jgi:hypothetical protein
MMSIERELLIGAVEWMHEYKYMLAGERDSRDTVLLDLIADLNKIEKFLAQPEQEQEPVAWHYIYDDGITVRERVTECMPLGEHYTVRPLYTAPPEQEPLSEQQISEGNQSMFNVTRDAFVKGVKFAEKHHGIGGEE